MTLVGVLICWALVLQSLEHLRLRAYPMDVLQAELPRSLVFLVRNDGGWNALRLVASLVGLLWPSWPLAFALLLCQWVIALRWRGTVNGGSDFMTFHVLLAWTVGLASPSLLPLALTYVAVQLVLSYFVAGVVKIRNPEWRSGRALGHVLEQYGWALPTKIWRPLAFVILAFELGFPLAFFFPWPFAVVGLAFHLVNAYVLGLNRFFWAWLAAYPALFVASKTF